MRKLTDEESYAAVKRFLKLHQFIESEVRDVTITKAKDALLHFSDDSWIMIGHKYLRDNT